MTSTIVSGSTGLVGRALVPSLRTGGHSVTRLVRVLVPGDQAAVYWNPANGTIDGKRLDGLDAVIHLAGENVASGRWTAEKKARIHDSRVEGTRLLCETLAGLKNKPRVLVCASAIGFYGDRGENLLDEKSPSGTGFLPQVCRAWEAATIVAADAGIRVVNLRLGVVLSPDGGALARLMRSFKIGLGGIIGSGDQYCSWITIDDAIRIICQTMVDQRLAGPVNAVAPNPVTNYELTRALGRVLRRPTLIPFPAVAVRLVLGEMGQELLLASTRVVPAKLLANGFAFNEPGIEGALQHLLGVKQ